MDGATLELERDSTMIVTLTSEETGLMYRYDLGTDGKWEFWGLVDYENSNVRSLQATGTDQVCDGVDLQG